MSQSADKTVCPSCGGLNDVSAEYCTSCGAPMAVVTQVTELARASDRDALETWRVYGIETELVGRDREMAELLEHFDEVVDESTSHNVALSGETGFGKSRLVAEFQRRAEAAVEECVVLESNGRADTSGPYGLFERLFKNRYYIGENEPPEAARQKFREAVNSVVEKPQAERVAHLVGHAIGLPFDDSPHVSREVDAPDSSELDRNSVEAMVQLLRADARENPLVVIFEDLHYECSAALRVLAHLVEQLDDLPVLFLLTWNPKDVSDGRILESVPFDAEIELQPLSDDEVETFVRQTLHKAEEIPEQLLSRIVDSAHGVPLSVEEMLRMLIGEGVIDTRRKEWTVDGDRIDEIDLPTTVQETVRARLAALSDDERMLLEMAACIGTRFSPELVRALYHLRADYDDEVGEYWFDENVDERVDELIESLERKDMIREQDEPARIGSDVFGFKHRIEREAVHEELPSQSKQRYHRLIAQWMQRQVEDDQMDRFAEEIARHFDLGQSLEQAASMYIRAAEYAADRYANQKAVDLFTKGLGYSSDAEIGLKLSAFHDLGSLYVRRGEYDRALGYFREMLRYSWIIDDPAKGGAALNKVGRAYRSLGEYDEALEYFDEALDLFWDVSDLRGVSSTLDDIGKIHWIRGEYDEAFRYYSGGLELRREVGHRRSIALSLSNFGSLKLQRGDLEEANDYYEEALDIRRDIDDRQGVADSFNTLGALCVERGNPQEALELFENALTIARNIGHRFMEASYLNNLGEAHLRAGNLDEAESHLDEARDVARSAGDKRVVYDALRNLARVALERESFRSARDRAQNALDLARDLDSEILVGMGRLALADIYAAWCRGGGDEEMEREAEEHYELAVERLRDVGHRSQLGRCLSRYGDFLLNRGETVRGRRHLEQARDIFEHLEIRKLREATEQAIRRL